MMPPRGRKPKPAALRALTGNPGKRPLNEERATIDTPIVPVEAPPFLDEYALQEWHRLLPSLLKSGVVTPGDRAVFAAYCQSWSRMRKAHELTNAAGGSPVVKGSNDVMKENALNRVARLEQRECIRYAVELGLTPSARSRIVALPVPEDDDPKENHFGVVQGGKA